MEEIARTKRMARTVKPLKVDGRIAMASEEQLYARMLIVHFTYDICI